MTEYAIKAVETAVEEAVNEIKEASIKSALEDFEKNLRRQLAKNVISIHDYYSVERFGSTMVIKVELKS